MHTHHLPRVIFGVCVVMLPLGAGAQTTNNNASQSSAAGATPAPASTSSIAGAGQTPNGTMHKQHKHQKHQKHHMVSHNRSHNHGGKMAVASAASNGETTYRAALRKCVEGPNARHDNCLDDAIARFGRP